MDFFREKWTSIIHEMSFLSVDVLERPVLEPSVTNQNITLFPRRAAMLELSRFSSGKMHMLLRWVKQVMEGPWHNQPLFKVV
jgi:hypothetical protein